MLFWYVHRSVCVCARAQCNFSLIAASLSINSDMTWLSYYIVFFFIWPKDCVFFFFFFPFVIGEYAVIIRASKVNWLLLLFHIYHISIGYDSFINSRTLAADMILCVPAIVIKRDDTRFALSLCFSFFFQFFFCLFTIACRLVFHFFSVFFLYRSLNLVNLCNIFNKHAHFRLPGNILEILTKQSIRLDI